MSKYIDLTGKRFCKLVAVRKADERYDGRHTFWECRCDCGNRVIVRKDSLESGHAKSCGCYAEEKREERKSKSEKRGEKRLYKTWQGMKSRCQNKNIKEYKNYGGRGITVCDEWKDDFQAFKKWAYQNGWDKTKNKNEQSIDRIDVNGNYEPDNCRFVNRKIQNYNKRETGIVIVNGEKKTLLDLNKEYGVPISKLRARFKSYSEGKMPIEKLISKENLITKPNQVIITVNGIAHNLTEWEKETGISRKTIANRYKKGAKTYEELFKRSR